MDFEILKTILPVFALVKIIYDCRNKIYDHLDKTKAGQYIILPFVLPYVFYGLYKLGQDNDFMMLMENLSRQKKITDFF